MTMGSTCCKRYESPYSPKVPDLNQIFWHCAEQFNSCMKDGKNAKPEPPARKYSASDISGPLPLGMTQPERPPRKRKCKITRCKSLVLKNDKTNGLSRSYSIHEIYFNDVLKVPEVIPNFKIDETPPSAAMVENKKNFLAGLLTTEDNNNNIHQSQQNSRRTSITDSLKEFENSLYDMLEEEPQKMDYDERSWRPQIPVLSYH